VVDTVDLVASMVVEEYLVWLVVVGQAALEGDLAVVYREELAVDLVRVLD
jgi:hypothetical protein